MKHCCWNVEICLFSLILSNTVTLTAILAWHRYLHITLLSIMLLSPTIIGSFLLCKRPQLSNMSGSMKKKERERGRGGKKGCKSQTTLRLSWNATRTSMTKFDLKSGDSNRETQEVHYRPKEQRDREKRQTSGWDQASENVADTFSTRTHARGPL